MGANSHFFGMGRLPPKVPGRWGREGSMVRGILPPLNQIVGKKEGEKEGEGGRGWETTAFKTFNPFQEGPRSPHREEKKRRLKPGGGKVKGVGSTSSLPPSFPTSIPKRKGKGGGKKPTGGRKRTSGARPSALLFHSPCRNLTMATRGKGKRRKEAWMEKKKTVPIRCIFSPFSRRAQGKRGRKGENSSGEKGGRTGPMKPKEKKKETAKEPGTGDAADSRQGGHVERGRGGGKNSKKEGRERELQTGPRHARCSIRLPGKKRGERKLPEGGGARQDLYLATPSGHSFRNWLVNAGKREGRKNAHKKRKKRGGGFCR